MDKNHKLSQFELNYIKQIEKICLGEKIMVNNEEDFLTEHQLTLILIGCMVGVGILSLPKYAVKIAKQDSWISVLLGTLNPLYITFVTSYIRKKHPKEDILDLSKKFMVIYLEIY